MPCLRIALFYCCWLLAQPVYAQHAAPLFTIPFERDSNETLHYEEIIRCYEKMAAAYPGQFQLSTSGSTDAGLPLHVAVLSNDGVFDPARIRQSGRRILLINNGIHPGEPEGIDATVLLLRDLLAAPGTALDHLVLVVIPVYNVGGCLNRNSSTRANQNGPESYGFRGNARNYDLNRDFIKSDTRNAQSFQEIFQRWMPDVFIDNHTSNGADYQYTLTLIPTLHNKLEAPLDQFLQQKMIPYLFGDLKNRGWEMTPYVDGPGNTPDSGLISFCDYARYSTGYAALWNTIGFMPETHMLKPFADRLRSTRAFMESVIAFVGENYLELGETRQRAMEITRNKTRFSLDWQLDTTRQQDFLFKGYAAKYKPSEVSGLPRLWYDRNEPYAKAIPYYNEYLPAMEIAKPRAYVIPQAWSEVVQRLQRNGVRMDALERDTLLETESYFIRSFETRNGWEGHYYHYQIALETKNMQRAFRKGDWLVRTNQEANRFIVETLEPQAPDSWFAWNFFEPILMQKEYFSAYVFEDLAADYLKEHPEIQAELAEKRQKDPKFAVSASAQLDWVYRHSPWYEPAHRMYPVARIN
ncbi:MAG: hypothetical protein IPL65_05840 [Lewinellaceae bacterium]|nr:hypothetical protein [Lewinellaceae bacterium]